MRYNVSVLVALFMLTNIAFGAVGDAGVSDGSGNVQPGNSYSTGIAGNSGPSLSTSAYIGNPLSLQQGGNYQQSQQSFAAPESNYGSDNYGANAPETPGPYQERLSADDLSFVQPEAESFQPDRSLNFISSSPPSGISIDAYTSGKGQGSWYYPGSVISRNMFYVQCSNGLKTTAGCAYRGYMPLWSYINYVGNFYVYEWYPGQWTPSVRWWGLKGQGFQKGWFTGDVPGWHILCFNCRDWSNYIYIYVWPNGGSAYSSVPYSAGPAGYSSPGQGMLPAGAPTPPDPNSENLMLPDYNLFQPYTGSYPQNPGQDGYVQGGMVSQASTNYPVQGAYPLQSTNNLQSVSPAQSGYTAYTATVGSPSQTYQAAYPKPVSYKYNQYYVQIYPGKLNTVAGAKCGQWLPLLSRIGSSGIYWSFEWTQCSSPPGYYCNPEVKCFGYKGIGWYQTWFRGNIPGWHILCFYDNDWSNYVYIYVWPA